MKLVFSCMGDQFLSMPSARRATQGIKTSKGAN